MKNKTSNLGGVIFIIVGIIFLFISYTISSSYNKYKDFAIEEMGTVTHIEGDKVTVKYIVGEEERTGILTYKEKDITEGGRIKIYYNSESPNQIKTRVEEPSNIGLIVIGVISVLLGVFEILRARKNNF